MSNNEWNCHSCVWAETFASRPDERTNYGCTKPGIEGYVFDPNKPPCIPRLDWTPKSSSPFVAPEDPPKPKETPNVTPTEIKRGLWKLEERLRLALNKKGHHAFNSRHEILGILVEEMHELTDAIHRGEAIDVENELFDVALSALFGAVCIKNCKVRW